MLGSRQGTVHNQRQGTGLASVFNGNQALNTYLGLAKEQRENEFVEAQTKAKAEAAKAADLKAAKKELTEFSPEYYYRHDKAKGTHLDEFKNMGAELLQRGINPYTGNDEQSQAFRKKGDQLKKMSAYSLQIKDQLEGTRTLLQKDPDKYSDASVLNLSKFEKTPLDKIVSENMEMPTLELKSPTLSAVKNVRTMIDDHIKNTGNKYMSDADVTNTIDRYFGDPGLSGELSKIYQDKYNAMEPDVQKAYREKAAAKGYDVTKAIAIDDLRNAMPAAGDVESDGPSWADVVDGMKFSEFKVENTDGVTEGGTSSTNTKQQLRTRAKLYLEENPFEYARMVESMDLTGMDEKEAKKRVVETLVETGWDLVPKKYSKSIENGGGGGKPGTEEYNKTREIWKQQLTSGDPSMMENAAAHLEGVKLGNGEVILEVVQDGLGSEYNLEEEFAGPQVPGTVRLIVDTGKKDVLKQPIYEGREFSGDELNETLNNAYDSGYKKSNQHFQPIENKTTTGGFADDEF